VFLAVKKYMNILIKIIVFTLFFYSTYCVLIFLMQRNILFPRYLIESPSNHEDIPGLEKIWINTSFGKVETWFLPPTLDPATKQRPVVIFAHGNGELIDFWPHELSRFNDFGIGILLVEYPGYGRSDGTPSQKSITEVFNSAYDFLVARKDIDPSKIILFGRSIGGGAVCTLAANQPSSMLILMSSFISVRSFASKYLFPGFLIRDPFDNLKVVSNYNRPVLVIHGKFDNIIPYKHGTALYRAAQHGKMITYDSEHNDCPPSWDTFWQDIESFLRNSGIIT
jgi:fermentation-respiration switch protein FrsA (DUF1100 family)